MIILEFFSLYALTFKCYIKNRIPLTITEEFDPIILIPSGVFPTYWTCQTAGERSVDDTVVITHQVHCLM